MSFVQLDTEANRITFELYDELKKPMSNIVEATATVKRIDNKTYTYGMSDFEISENFVTFVLPPSAVYLAGKCEATISVYDDNYGRLTIPIFSYTVTPELVSDTPIDETNLYPVLTDLINETNLLKETYQGTIDGSLPAQDHLEIVAARKGAATLKDKIDGIDTSIGDINTELDGVNSSLSNITQNKIFMAKYQRIDAETTDDGCFDRMIEDLTDSTTVFLEPNKTYIITSIKQIKKNNINFIGVNSTIQSNKTDTNSIICFGDDYRAVLPQTVSIQKGSNTFTLTDVTGINVGDILKMFNTTAGVNNYCDGVYGEVLFVDTVNKKVILNISAHKTFTANRIDVHTAYRNIYVSGINFIGSTTYKDICMQFKNMINVKVERCSINGNYGRMGILFHGINGEFSFNSINSCYDRALVDNITGYGISVSGHNITIKHNKIWNCRHCIAAADRNFYTTGLLYEKNIVSGSFDSAMPSAYGETYAGQVLDIHANAEGIIKDNLIYNVRGYGIAVRCDKCWVIGNKIVSSKSTSDGSVMRGIYFHENANNDLKAIDNEFIGYFQSAVLFGTGNNIGLTNIEVRGNKIEYGDIYISLTDTALNVNDVFIEKNIIMVDGGIFSANPLINAVIKKNRTTAGTLAWKCCVQINNASSKTVIIEDNDLTQGTVGGDPIRYANNANIVKHNKFKTLNSAATTPVNYGATTNNIIKDNMWTKSDNTLVIYSV